VGSDQEEQRMTDGEKEILRELRIIRMIAIAQATKEMKQVDAIALMANAGMEPKDIAAVLGTTPGTVSVALVALRKKGKVSKR
jgi:DNA-binding CsgD family transcriptional regulator